MLIQALAGLMMLAPLAEAQQLARDFVITNRATKAPIRRDDFAGKIVFLDFFAYWCPPCVASSPTVEKEIAEYYQLKGGNPNGVKVEVIGVNIESDNPTSTDDFISKVGFQTVADDFGAADEAWAQFGQGGIPHFVIISGVSGGSHTQWQVLDSGAGFKGSAFYRSLIDSVKPGADPGTNPGTDPGTNPGTNPGINPVTNPEPGTAPEIVIEAPFGSSLVSGSAKRSFGSVKVASATGWKNFVIKNNGTANLTGMKVTKAGKNPKDFIVTPVSRSSITPGTATSIRVRFSPKAVGTRTAVIRISSNDADENPFIINLTGRGVALK